MNFRIKITAPEEFEKSYLQLKAFVNSNINAEIVDDCAVVMANPSEENKWHLFMLASFYGGRTFTKNNRLRLLESQPCYIKIQKPLTNAPIEIITRWNQKIAFNPIFLEQAESIMIRKFIDMLSADDQEKLKNVIVDIDFDQPVSLQADIKYAYQIIDNTLILIREQNQISTITNLWKTEWYDVSI